MSECHNYAVILYLKWVCLFFNEILAINLKFNDSYRSSMFDFHIVCSILQQL